ncbi:MAG: hypothetical protein ACTSQX_13105, partial [Candidatus Heimdallarchaeota archaeon]
PILFNTTPDLKQNRWGCIEVDPETMESSIPNVYAGGDIVTGAATVISAMGQGRVAAEAIHARLSGKKQKPKKEPVKEPVKKESAKKDTKATKPTTKKSEKK